MPVASPGCSGVVLGPAPASRSVCPLRMRPPHPHRSHLTSPLAHLTRPLAHFTSPLAHFTSPLAHLTSPLAHLTSSLAHVTRTARHTREGGCPDSPRDRLATPARHTREGGCPGSWRDCCGSRVVDAACCGQVPAGSLDARLRGHDEVGGCGPSLQGIGGCVTARHTRGGGCPGASRDRLATPARPAEAGVQIRGETVSPRLLVTPAKADVQGRGWIVAVRGLSAPSSFGQVPAGSLDARLRGHDEVGGCGPSLQGIGGCADCSSHPRRRVSRCIAGPSRHARASRGGGCPDSRRDRLATSARHTPEGGCPDSRRG